MDMKREQVILIHYHFTMSQQAQVMVWRLNNVVGYSEISTRVLFDLTYDFDPHMGPMESRNEGMIFSDISLAFIWHMKHKLKLIDVQSL